MIFSSLRLLKSDRLLEAIQIASGCMSGNRLVVEFSWQSNNGAFKASLFCFTSVTLEERSGDDVFLQQHFPDSDNLISMWPESSNEPG
jgi:hypothetical protein